MPIPLPISPWQEVVWNILEEGDYIDCHILGGRRIGKSGLAYRWSGKYHLNGRNSVWICASEKLAEANWNDVANLYLPYAHPKFKSVQEKGVLGFMDEHGLFGYLRRASFGATGGGRGNKAGIIMADEEQLITEDDMGRLRPLLLTEGGSWFGCLTPPEGPKEHAGAEWLKSMFFEGTRWRPFENPTWPSYELAPEGNDNRPSIGVNPKRPDTLLIYRPTMVEDIAWILQYNDRLREIDHGWEYYETMAQLAMEKDRYEMGEFKFQREYNLIWALEAGARVYDNIKEGEHIKEEFDYDPDYPVHLGIDLGGKSGARTNKSSGWHTVLFYQWIPAGVRYGKQIYKIRVFDELATQKIYSPGTMLNIVKQFCAEYDYKPPFSISKYPRYRPYAQPTSLIPDPRATGYIEASRGAKIPIVSRKNVPIDDGIHRVKWYADNTGDDGKPLLQVHPRCKMLRQNFMAYERDENNMPIDKWNDAADCLRYICWHMHRLNGLSDMESKEAEAEREGASASVQLVKWR